MSNLPKIIGLFVPDKLKEIRRGFLHAKFNEDRIRSLEETLLRDYNDKIAQPCTPIFIIASPRTGSTFLYQILCKYANVAYFSNASTCLSETPLLSWLLADRIVELARKRIECVNKYGVSKGTVGPSEASEIFRNWFPHVHPSQTKSNNFFSTVAMQNMQQVVGVIQYVGGKPLLTKNAWNCFRLNALLKAFPDSKFIYLQRDIVDSSYSTLQARKKKGAPETVWNSASPANLAEIKKLPYYMQVVEQQVQTNRVVQNFFDSYYSVFRLKYEDFLQRPAEILGDMLQFCDIDNSQSIENVKSEVRAPEKKNDRVDADMKLIVNYCRENGY